MSENIYTLTIYRIHGEPMIFQMALPEEKEMGLAEDLERSLTRTSLAIEADGSLHIIPYNNVQHIECTPAPGDLPLNIITGARQLFEQ